MFFAGGGGIIEILKDPRCRCLDEVRFRPNINILLQDHGFKVKTTIPYADIGHLHLCYYCSEYRKGNRCERVDNRKVILAFRDTRTYKVALNSNDEVEFSEVAYVHFQKRKITVDELGLNNWLLVPNKIIPYVDITRDMLKLYAKDNIPYFMCNYMRRIIKAVRNRIPV